MVVTASAVGLLDAAAALATIDYHAGLLTGQTGLYAGLGPDERVIPLDDIVNQWRLRRR